MLLRCFLTSGALEVIEGGTYIHNFPLTRSCCCCHLHGSTWDAPHSDDLVKVWKFIIHQELGSGESNVLLMPLPFAALIIFVNDQLWCSYSIFLIWMIQKCPKESFLILHFVQFSGRVILDAAEVLNQSLAFPKKHTSGISSASTSPCYISLLSRSSMIIQLCYLKCHILDYLYFAIPSCLCKPLR